MLVTKVKNARSVTTNVCQQLMAAIQISHSAGSAGK